VAVKTEPASTAVQIYNDEALQQIPTEHLIWAGIVPKEKKKGKKTNRAEAGGKKEATAKVARGKKRVLGESNTANAKARPAKKKQKAAPTVTEVAPPTKKKTDHESSQQDVDQSPSAMVVGLREAIGPLSTEEIVDLADTRYSSLLSMDEKSSKSGAIVLHAVTSSLTDKDSKTLASFCKMLKANNVTLKITKDFNLNKTQLCITAAAASLKRAATKQQPKETVDVVSKSRTLKVMRSALAGIPILTPHWIECCLKEGHIIAPSGAMCIRTLPRKQTVNNADARGENEASTTTEHFGVAKYAAAYQKSSLSTSNNHLLSGVSVMLCGSSAGSGMTKDLKVLLQQAGASIVNSITMASRTLTDMSKEKESGSASPSGPSFVFLCDDSLTDKSCGISEALFQQAKRLVISKKNAPSVVYCVHFSWLFDSISCATPMEADAYEPLAPRSKALWDVTTGCMETPIAPDGTDRNESQIY